MAGYRKNLGDLYNNILNGNEHTSKPKLSDMYGEVLNEQDQYLLPLDVPGTGKPESKKDAAARIKKATGVSKAEAERMVASGDPRYAQRQIDVTGTDSVENIQFSVKDLEELNALSPIIKAKIYNQMQKGTSHQLHDIFVNNFHDGKENRYTHLAIDILTASELNLAELQYDLAADRIDVDKLTTVGTYKATDIFPASILDALVRLKGVGVGASQAGPYEHALDMLSKRMKLSTKGDIEIDGKQIELKAESGRVGIEGWPNGSKARDVLHALAEQTKNEGFIAEIKSYLKTVGMKTLFDAANKHGLEEEQKENIANEMFKFLYTSNYSGLVDRFTKATSYQEVYVELQKTLFNSYKDSKKGTTGEWQYLIGFNLSKNGVLDKDGATIAVVQTAEQFVETPKYTSSPSVIPSGDGASPRDYMFDFRPMQG